MTVYVDPNSSEPVYRQVYGQIKSAISAGNLGPGRKLPPVRELSSRLHVSHLTVHRAYQLLAEDQMIELRHGSGAYVSAIKQREQATEYLKEFLALGQSLDADDSPHRARIDSMATYTPDLRLFDWNALFTGVHCQVKENEAVLGPHRQPGDPRLQRALSRWIAHYGIESNPEDVFVRPGGSPLDWLVPSYLQPGDHILVEQPCMLFAADELAKLHLVPIGIPATKAGPDIDFVRTQLRNPLVKALYIAPNSGFGSGLYWSRTQRKFLIEALTDSPRLVIEDLSCGVLHFSNRPSPLAAEAPHLPILTNIDLTQTLGAGLPLAWCYASPTIDRHLRDRMANLAPAPLRPLELALAHKIEQGEFEKSLRRAAMTYARRYQLFRTGLVPNLPVEIDLLSPQTGYSLTLFSPVPLPPDSLFRESLKAHCPVMPGLFVGIRGACQHFTRINYGTIDEKRLVNVGQRLGQVITRMFQQARANSF